MCGLVAIFSLDGMVNLNELNNGMKSLYHRGPDSNDYWISETKKIGLGHARLSVIDLKTGGQPLISSDKNIHLIVNGELYGYKDIRKDLIKKGYKFLTNSDSEIIIALYQEYSCDLFSYLRGEFSFILWDEENQRLLVARDRFGIKPLFYAKKNNNLYFASEIKALIAMGITAQWNWTAALQLETETQPSTETLFKGVHSIGPGYFAYINNNHFDEICYWDLKYIKKNSSFHNDDVKFINEFTEIFEESVRLRISSDVPVGCYLSGGLDSCSVLGTMAKICTEPIEAFTISFIEDSHYNEINEAAEMAALVGANHHKIPVNFQDIADNFFETVWHNESSIANTSPVAKFILSQKVKELGCKVVLTGEGADEMFAGYSPFCKELLEKNSNLPISLDIQKELKVNSIYNTSFDNSLDLSYIKSKLNFIPFYFKSFCSRTRYFDSLRKELFSQIANNNILGKQLIDSLNIEPLKGVSQLNKTLYLWAKSMLPNVMLTALGDRMEMSHSVEGRVPFLDHKLAEYAASIPEHMKIRKMTEKYVVRESRRNVLTNTVYQRQKRPFVAPPLIYKKDNPMLVLMREVFNSSSLADLPFYKQNSVIRLLDSCEKIPAEERPVIDMVLTHILSLCVIQSRFSMLP